jgi:hypothetical protein
MADKKITQLTALTTPANTDLLLIVDDPSGTPVSKKIELGDVFGESAQTVFSNIDITANTSASSGTTKIGGNTITFTTGSTGSSTFNTGVIINEDGSTSNTRIESDTHTNMFFVDAVNSRIGLKTNAPTVTLDVNDSKIRIRGISSVATSNAALEGWNTGEIGWDSNYIYVAVGSTGANSILRATLSGF